MRVAYALCLVSLCLGLQRSAAADAASDRFDAAIALEGVDRAKEAAEQLERFAHELPTHTLAPDALAEAATLWEGRLHDPARALLAWTVLATQYPESRSAHRALAHTAGLQRMLAGGGDPQAIGEFQRMLDDAGVPVSDAARTRVREFLAAHPAFALADQGLYWLGQAAEDRKLDEEALRLYAEAAQLPGEYAPRAARARAELLLRRARLVEAQQAFDGLARFPDSVSRAAVIAGRAAIVVQRQRRMLALGLALALVLWALAMLLLARRALWPPPIELRFFLPVAVVFSLAAASEHRAIAGTVVLIAVGGSLVVWLAGAAQRALMARGARVSARLAIGVLAAAAIVAIASLAIHANAMEDVVKETLRTGPER